MSGAAVTEASSDRSLTARNSIMTRLDSTQLIEAFRMPGLSIVNNPAVSLPTYLGPGLHLITHVSLPLPLSTG